MAVFPKVQSPCPYKADLAVVMDGDFCRMCKRSVIDLTAWSDAERVAFLRGCEEEVCVSYRLRPMLAAAAMVAAVAALLVAAQDAPVPAAEMAADAGEELDWVIVGGITDPAAATFIDEQGKDAPAELPVTYEPAAKDDQAALAIPGR